MKIYYATVSIVFTVFWCTLLLAGIMADKDWFTWVASLGAAFCGYVVGLNLRKLKAVSESEAVG